MPPADTGLARPRRPARLSALSLPFLASLAACVAVPTTVEHDPSLAHVELQGYRFHVRTFGDPQHPPVIVVHGGPGGDLQYLLPLQGLASDHFVVFYDQRGTGRSPRVPPATQTLARHLDDLHLLVRHFGGTRPVRLIGHSWGAMLTVAYLGRHPERVSHAVAVEPGMLTPGAAQAFVQRFRAEQSWRDALPLFGAIALAPFVSRRDGQERFDFVMTRLMNRARPGGPYQCAGESLPPDAFARAGHAAFDQMLKPVLDRPARFTDNLLRDIGRYPGPLLMVSSSCSFIGYAFQHQHHMPFMPAQTQHLKAEGMGHNMLTLHPAWSLAAIDAFFNGRPLP